MFEYFYSIPLCLTVVTIQIDPPLTRTISEGSSTDVCVSKDIGSVRAVNFSLTPMDGSAGGMLKCILIQCGVCAMLKLRAAHHLFHSNHLRGCIGQFSIWCSRTKLPCHSLQVTRFLLHPSSCMSHCCFI